MKETVLYICKKCQNSQLCEYFLKSKLIWKITKSKAILINKITLHHQIGTSSSSNFYINKWITNTIKWHGHIKISFLLLSFNILKIGHSWKFMLIKILRKMSSEVSSFKVIMGTWKTFWKKRITWEFWEMNKSYTVKRCIIS